MDITVSHNHEKSRYEAITANGEVVSFADYIDANGIRIFPHTVTKTQYQGQGIAAQVAAKSLDDARAEGLKISPACSFYVTFIDEHPEYADLLA